MKSIGNGARTRVWLDKWVFDEAPRRPLNIQSQIDLNLMVSSLIDPVGAWDLPTLTSLFPPTDVVKITVAPPDCNAQDHYLWAYSREGCYTVKSGHWLLLKLKNHLQGSTLAPQQVNRLKEEVWELRTLPKIKMFLWRALSGALAVAECLNSHGLHVDMLCKLCKLEPESISHVLFSCTAARRAWEIANMATVTALEESALWEVQSKLVQVSSIDSSRSAILGKRWLKPSGNVLKCNINSSWINSTWMCGGAWIVRDYTGNALYHARDAFPPCGNRIAAELRCILWAVQSLKDLHLANVEIWAECGPAIEASKQPDKWPRYRSYSGKIRRLFPKFPRITLRLSSSQANSLARDIAKSVTRDGRFQSYLALGGPAWLHNCIIEESRYPGLNSDFAT